MSSRERWTVYPLLFFSLLMGIKSNYQQENPLKLRVPMIECERLQVRLINGRPASMPTTIITTRPSGLGLIQNPDVPDPDVRNPEVQSPDAEVNAAERDSAQEQPPEVPTSPAQQGREDSSGGVSDRERIQETQEAISPASEDSEPGSGR